MKKFKNYGLDLCHVILHHWNPCVWHPDITISCRACIKDDWAKHNEHENIEKKVDIFHNLNVILAKTRNLIFHEKKSNNLVFLSLKSDSAKCLSSKTTWFRRIQFLEMHHIINSCTNMNKIYGNKDAKSYTTWSFPSCTAKTKFIEKLADMFDRFAELYEIVGRYCDTTTYHKNHPYKISPLILSQSVLNLSASVDGPFSQGKPTTAWCRRSMHRKSNGWANTRKHSTPPIMPSPGCTET